jgi:hypothetical protein
LIGLASVLASSSGNNTLNDVEPGVLGFLVVAGIGVALVFLLRSMNKQIRKLPPPEDEPGDSSGTTGPEEAVGAVRQDSDGNVSA